MHSELSGDFRKAVIESLYDPDYYDAHSLHEAMKGVGTRENVLTEILTSRSNHQIENIKIIYKKSEKICLKISVYPYFYITKTFKDLFHF